MSAQVNRADDIATIHVSGRFTFSMHDEFRACARECLAVPGLRGIDVDLGQVDFLDSSALGMLLVLKERCETAGIRRPCLLGVKGMVRQVLAIANFQYMFDIR